MLQHLIIFLLALPFVVGLAYYWVRVLVGLTRVLIRGF